MRPTALAVAVTLALLSAAVAQDVRVPQGIRYKTASKEVNQEAQALLEMLFNHEIPEGTLDDALCKAVMCSAGTWRVIEKEAERAGIKGCTNTGPAFEIDKDGKPKVVMRMGRHFNTPEQKREFWKVFSKVLLTEPATLRKLTPHELAYYWAIYPFDIEEPIFTVECGKTRIIVDCHTDEGKPKVFWISYMLDIPKLVSRPTRKAPPPRQGGGGTNELVLAAQEGDAARVKALLDGGVPVDTVDPETRSTALHVASFGGYKEVVALLLARGAKVHARSVGLMTPLHAAAYEGKTEVMALLISKGADPNMKTGDRSTPLHFAARGGQAEAAALLIEKGAKVNAATRFGATPLHFACVAGHTAVAKVLIEHKANINAKDSKGFTPLFLAKKKKHKDLVAYLESKGAK